MMTLRRKPPVVEFTTLFPKAAEMYPPTPAAKILPDWWREQPSFLKNRRYPNLRLRQDSTIKGCPGVADFMGLGYVLPLWADHIITATSDGYMWEAAARPQIELFPPEVWEHFPRPEGTHPWLLKLPTPWYIKVPRGWSIMLTQPWYNRPQPWSVFPGVLDADRCPVLNFICMWHAPLGEAVLIKAGTPLFQVVPFRREKLALDIKCDPEKFQAMTGSGVGAVEDWKRLIYGAYREDGRERAESKS